MVSGRTFLVVACVAMVALAGCSSGPGTDTTAMETNGQTATDETTVSDGESEGFTALETPSWMTADGVNSSSLLGAHYGSLAGTSYRANTYQNSSGLLSLTQNATRRVAANGTTIYEADTVRSNGNSTTKAFLNDTWVVTTTTNETRTVDSAYRIGSTPSPLNDSDRLQQYIQIGDFSVNRTFEVDGQTRIEYTASSAANKQSAQGITSYAGTFVVSPDGRIHELSVAVVQEAQYGNATSEFEYTLSDVGRVDAPTPSWVSTAREQATVVDFAYSFNGSVLKIEHQGGDDVEAGSQLVLSPPGRSGVAYTTLSANFSAGETLYVTAGDGRELNATRGSPPSADRGIAPAVSVAMYGPNGGVIVRTTLSSTEGTVDAIPSGWLLTNGVTDERGH